MSDAPDGAGVTADPYRASATSRTVTGTPAPFLRRFKTWRRAVLALLSPPFLLAAIAWLYSASHTKIGPGLTKLDVSFVTEWTLIAGSIAALVGIWVLITVPRKPIYSCECPLCGAHGVRDFSDVKYNPPACGSCYAYLHANGRAITEESDEALEMFYPPYVVPRARYEAVPQELLRGKPSPYLRFQMPTFCAVCGSEDAKYTRSIHGVGEDRFPKSGGGMLSKIAADALDCAQADLGMGGPMSGKPQPDQSRSARTYRYNKYLRNLEVPVCGPHREHKFEPAKDAIADCYGDLGFASYRYYKAFCKLNGIAPPRDKA
jgi:hypothetical protein